VTTEAEFREKAVQARAMAARATFGDDKSLWQGIATRWDRLATAARGGKRQGPQDGTSAMTLRQGSAGKGTRRR
jgi:hypothetical protein